jgi:hypothetical protein
VFDAKAAVAESDAAVFDAAVLDAAVLDAAVLDAAAFETAVLDAAEALAAEEDAEALDAETLAEAEEAKADTELAEDAEFADEDELADETADDATLVLDPVVAEEIELWVDEREVEEAVVELELIEFELTELELTELELTELELDGTLVLPELSMADAALVELSTAKDDTFVEIVGDGEIKEDVTLVDATMDEFDMLEADEPTREDVFTAKEELKPAAADEDIIVDAEVSRDDEVVLVKTCETDDEEDEARRTILVTVELEDSVMFVDEVAACETAFFTDDTEVVAEML